MENLVLNALQDANPAAISGRLRPVDFQHGTVVAQAGARIDTVLFPVSGMISLVVELQNGECVEAAMVGRNGVVGGAACFGARFHVNTAFAQVPGRGWAMAASDFQKVVRGDETLTALLQAHEQLLLAQAQQTAACGAKHHIPHRLASWLLRTADLVDSNDIPVTQEFIAQMLGVQRASVSIFAAQLQDEGLIRYRRGRLTITDYPGLKNRACECCEALEAQQRRLFGGPPRYRDTSIGAGNGSIGAAAAARNA